MKWNRPVVSRQQFPPPQLVHSYPGEKVSRSRRNVFRVVNFSSKDASVQLDSVRGLEGCLRGEGRQEDRRGRSWWVLVRKMIWMLVRVCGVCVSESTVCVSVVCVCEGSVCVSEDNVCVLYASVVCEWCV